MLIEVIIIIMIIKLQYVDDYQILPFSVVKLIRRDHFLKNLQNQQNHVNLILNNHSSILQNKK